MAMATATDLFNLPDVPMLPQLSSGSESSTVEDLPPRAPFAGDLWCCRPCMNQSNSIFEPSTAVMRSTTALFLDALSAEETWCSRSPLSRKNTCDSPRTPAMRRKKNDYAASPLPAALQLPLALLGTPSRKNNIEEPGTPSRKKDIEEPRTPVRSQGVGHTSGHVIGTTTPTMMTPKRGTASRKKHIEELGTPSRKKDSEEPRTPVRSQGVGQTSGHVIGTTTPTMMTPKRGTASRKQNIEELGTPSRKKDSEEPTTPVRSQGVGHTSGHVIGMTTPTTMTPKGSTPHFKAHEWTPPPAPNMHQAWTPPPVPNFMSQIAEEVDNDLAMALSFNSVPLLSLALCATHVCKGGCQGPGNCGKSLVDHSMHEALNLKSLDAVTLLLKEGPKELLHEPCAGMQPLARALKSSAQENDVSYQAARLLLQHGADPNLGSGPLCDTPLHQAAAAGELYAVNLLLEFGADPNARNLKALTPLHSLCQASTYLPSVCKEQVMVALLQNGADPVQTDQSGFRAVDYLYSPLGPFFVMVHPDPTHAEMNARITKRLLLAASLHVRLQLTLACGSGEHDTVLSKLPLLVLDKVVELIL